MRAQRASAQSCDPAMILILTRPTDIYHSNQVIALLEKKSAPYLRFDTGDFPTTVGITVGYHDGSCDMRCVVHGRTTQLDEAKTVWNRRPLPPLPSATLPEQDQNFVRDESRHFMRGLWHLLADRFWVNPYLDDRAAHAKPFQLRVAQEVGLAIPRTLLTNVPSDALAFFDQCEGSVVYKTFTGYVRESGDTGYGIYTTRVTREVLEEHVARIALAPCQFQEHLRKQYDLRVTVIDGECFACEIHSQAHASTVDDWRRFGPDWGQLVHKATTLPPNVAQQVLNLMSRLGLVFGCIDFVVTSDGRLVFLEINPNGQWMWLEQAASLPLLDRFTELLIKGPHERHSERGRLRGCDSAVTVF